MRIGIDIDDTMTFIKDDLLKAACEYDKRLGNSGVPLNDNYYIGKRFNWNKEEYHYFMGEVRKKVVMNAKIRNGLIEILTKLRQMGHKIIIITARTNYYYKDSHGMTIEWLKKEQIPYDKLILGSITKKKDCINEKIEIFLDDDINNCLSVYDCGIKTFIMDNNDNYLDNSDIIRVYDFYDFYEKIENILKKSK